MCMIGSKRVVFEGGSRGPPQDIFSSIELSGANVLWFNASEASLKI